MLFFRSEAQPDQPAPVLPQQDDVAEVERDDQRAHPVNVPLIRVIAHRGRLVASAEAHEIRGNASVPPIDEDRDHRSVEVAPAGLAVQEKDGRRVRRSFIDVVDPHVAGVDVVRRKRIAGQIGEALVGRSQDLHGCPSSPIDVCATVRQSRRRTHLTETA